MTDKNDRDAEGCCTGPDAAKGSGGAESVTMPPPVPGRRQVADHAVHVPGGRAYVGTSRTEIADDGEGPVRRVGVKPFLMGATSVTNAEFAAFVEETGHMSEAERWGWSFVFWSDVPASAGPTEGVVGSEWWRRVGGANWRDIHGPGTAEATWHAEHLSGPQLVTGD